ncbi:PqqD family protein [Rhodospirillum rubrum]|nr:PqqD family protein [Rhodospirillum rubrum]MBK1677002.1 PqqD family protein [Rhodospirillum rubrum]
MDRRPNHSKDFAFMITLASRIAIRPGLMAREIDDEMVMMDIESGQYFTLDGVGTEVWRLLGQPIQVSTLGDRLMELYEGDRAAIDADLLRFLESLLEKRLIEIRP